MQNRNEKFTLPTCPWHIAGGGLFLCDDVQRKNFVKLSITGNLWLIFILKTNSA
jgi:hypothetical protein